jgi:hypothetical protein
MVKDTFDRSEATFGRQLGVIPHPQEHLLYFVRLDLLGHVLIKQPSLMSDDRIALHCILFGKIGTHVADEIASDLGR